MSTTLSRRLLSLERMEGRNADKSGAELTDAELCRIAGVPLDATDEELQRVIDGRCQPGEVPA